MTLRSHDMTRPDAKISHRAVCMAGTFQQLKNQGMPCSQGNAPSHACQKPMSSFCKHSKWQALNACMLHQVVIPAADPNKHLTWALPGRLKQRSKETAKTSRSSLFEGCARTWRLCYPKDSQTQQICKLLQILSGGLLDQTSSCQGD